MPSSTAHRASAGALALVLALAGSVGCAAAIDALDVEQAQTAARVITALVNDPEIGTRPIDVRVSRGIVRLTGRVRSGAEAARAVEIARQVQGVTRVDSSLRIADDPEPDNEGFDDSGRAQASPPRADRPRVVAAEFAELESRRNLLAVGASVGWSDPDARNLDSGLSFGPALRFGAGRGLGPSIGFDWFQTRIHPENGPAGVTSRLRVRPLMAGLSYTLRAAAISVSPSLVAGYAFNSLAVPSEGTATGRLAVDVRNSFVWRPGVSVWIDTAPRTAVNLSVGHVFTRPRVTFVENGRIDQQTLSARTTVVRVGLAYKVF